MRLGLVGLAALGLGLLGQTTASAGGNGKGTLVGGPFEVEKVGNVAYYEGSDADPVRHKLDFYYPKGPKDYPVLFFVHGGAWRSGSKELYGGLGKVFAKNGIGVVVINYRLSPKVQHPAHVEDVARAFAWTHKNVGKYGAGQTSCLSSAIPPAAISPPCSPPTRAISRLTNCRSGTSRA